jgi:hypothetical protein
MIIHARLFIASASLVVASATGGMAGLSEAPPTTESAFRWEQANAAAAVARTEADCLRAAEFYTALVRDSGVHNGVVFYNMGAILLKGGLYDRSRIATLRAERYLGTTPEIRRNLLLAAARGDAKAEVSLPWYRIPLFWHYGLPYRIRLAVAMVSIALILFITLLWQRNVRRTIEPLFIIASTIAIIFATSALTTAYQEHRDDKALLMPSAAPQEARTP